MRTKKEQMCHVTCFMCGLTVWMCCVCKLTCVFSGLQSGQLSVLGDKSKQGRLAARPSRHRTTPHAPWSASSRATPWSKYKHYNTDVIHTRCWSLPEQVCCWKQGWKSVKSSWICLESIQQSHESTYQCFACVSTLSVCTWEWVICVARKPGMEEAEQLGRNSQSEPIGGANEQSQNGTRPKRYCR